MDLQGYLELTDRFSYNPQKYLGKGNFGKVYLGWDKEKKIQVAVKHVPPSTLRRTDGLEQRQINILKDLENKNVMGFYGDYRNKKDGLFLFIEYCQKGTLSTYLDKKRLNEAEALNLAKQLVSGMAYINSKGYFHRDLKPDNLLLDKDQNLKIADFGTARAFSQNPITSTFQRCTPIYSAPEVYMRTWYEQIKGQYTQNCDVFSAGYIIYELITGEQLTSGLTTSNELRQFLQRNKQGFKLSHPSLKEPWTTILSEMLDFNPRTRPNFKQLMQKMDKLLASSNKFPERPTSIQERSFSSQIIDKSIQILKGKEFRANYLINCLKILSYYQQQKSEFIPRVYKLLCIFYSLTHYCCLSQKLLSFLQSPENIEVDGQTIQKLGDKILSSDKKKLLQLAQNMGQKVNKGVTQVRTILIKQILPEIENIMREPQGNLERRVIMDQGDFKKEISNFIEEEYNTIKFYSFNLEKCVNNLFRTRAETQILSDADLKIYLVLLLVVKQNNGKQSKYNSESVKIMDRKTLIQEIQLAKYNS